MNSATMATNLLGRPVRLRERPMDCATDRGSIVLVAVDPQGIHFLIELSGKLVFVDSPDKLEVLD